MDKKNYKLGLSAALVCNLFWGFLPIYWNALKPIESGVIIFYRVVLMALVCYIACVYQFGVKDVFKPMFESRKKVLTYTAAGIAVTINWSLYIWAVNAGHVIQTCMGYFLEPLIICLCGMIFYKEHANKWKKIALLFGAGGLLVTIIGYGQMPAIAVCLALSFAVYSAIKKSVDLPPIQSLLYETLFLAPIALLVIFYLEASGNGALQVGSGWKFFLLMFAGLATAIPMGLFSYAVNKIDLISAGLTNYVSTSIALVIGIFLFKEPFDLIQLSAFSVIWIGLIFLPMGKYGT